MKTAIRWLFAFLLISLLEIGVSPSSLFASSNDDNCGTVAAAPSQTTFSHTGGRYITSEGVLTSFVLFVRFADDSEVSTSWPNPAVLPLWA